MAKNSQNILAIPGVSLALSMSGWLVGPVIIATVIGNSLDQRYGTKPWLFLVSLGLGFVVTTVGIVKNATEAIKSISGSVSPKSSDVPDQDNKIKEQ